MDTSSNLRNFLILGTQRTGSQALYFALNLHPEVVCGGEWTFKTHSHQKIKKAEQALAGEFQQLLVGRSGLQARYSDALTPETRWLGFKILFRSSAKWLGHPALAPALWVDRFHGHLQWLRGRPDIHIIQLVRRDPVEWLKSKYLSRATGMTTNREYPEGFKVRIPIAPALRALASKRLVDDGLAALANTNPYHRVFYEDFREDNRTELESCLDFLGCDAAKLPVDGAYRKRQSKGDAANYIENYDELADALERNGVLPPTVESAS